ncbi:MAG: dihydrofolate reductase family protein [Flavisolibacter sp.]
MRKIILQMQITLDGFVCGPNGEMDWMVWNWDEVVKNHVIELMNSVDTFLMGRATGEGMAVYWPTVAGNPESLEEDKWMAERLNTLPKVVFSKTVTHIDWTNVRVACDIEEEIKELKKEPGQDIMLYGGAGIVSSFIVENLIDEYHLFVNPVVIGRGKGIFGSVQKDFKLKLIRTRESSTGIVILQYVPENENAINSSLKSYEYASAGGGSI